MSCRRCPRSNWVTAELGEAIVACLPVETMREIPVTPATTAATDVLIGITDVLLEVHQAVTGDALCAAVHNFRRWDHLVQRPLAASTYSLSLRQTEDLLQPMGIPSSLVRRIFSSFARRLQCSGSWSRVLDEAPERRIDALGLFSGLALTCRGTANDKLAVLFSLFDPSEAGLLTEDDLGAMISSCASFLHHLGLSTPLSGDEASFAAGEPFGRQQAPAAQCAAAFGGDTTSEPPYPADDINFATFRDWAHSAELPTRALGLLALPHRLSRIIDLVSAKGGSLLRDRYTPWAKCTKGIATNTYETTSNHQRAEERALISSPSAIGLKRRIEVNKQPRFSKIGSDQRPFGLPPFLRRIGPHGASIVLEVATSGAPTAEGPTWRFVVSVEEREGSRFSSVDSQPVTFQGGTPRILLLSNLRAATDHRLQISWSITCNAAKGENRVSLNVSPGVRHARTKQTTLRFTTLPADAAMIALPGEIRRKPSSPQAFPEASRRCIKLVSMKDARSWDALQLFHTWTTRALADTKADSGCVSMIVRHENLTSLDSSDKNGAADPWWTSTAEATGDSLISRNLTDSEMLVQAWPPATPPSDDGRPQPPTATDPGDIRTLHTAPDVVLSRGEDREQIREVEEEGGAGHQSWAGRKSVSSGDIDIMIHLRPDWRAVEAVRRCFQILQQCRCQSSAFRDDARRLVSSEITTAIRSLLSKSFRLQRRTLQDRARRACAHTILGGVKSSWLGLEEDELMTHDKVHRNIIRHEVESTIQTYLLSNDADGGTSDGNEEFVPLSFLSNGGGTMAIGSRCFLIRPPSLQSIRDDNLVPPIIGRDRPEDTAASTRVSDVDSAMGVRARGGSAAGMTSSATGTADDAVGHIRRESSRSVIPERDENMPSNTLPSVRVGDASFSPVANLERKGSPVDTCLARSDRPGSPSPAEDDATTSNATNRAPQQVTKEGRTGDSHGSEGTAEVELIPRVLPRATGEVDSGSPVSLSTDGVSKDGREEAGNATAVAHAGIEDSPPARGDLEAEDAKDGGMDGADADGAARTGLALRQSGEVSEGATSKAALKALLRSMSRAAEALPRAASTEAGRHMRQETTGCTAVVFLDAPLVTPGLCRRRKILQNERTQPAVPRRLSSSVTEISAGQQDAVATCDVDSPAQTLGNHISDIDLLDSGGEQHSDHDRGDDGDDDDDVHLCEQHPAGLGDPTEALEALLLWIEEGESSGFGRREVLLVCCGAHDSRCEVDEDQNTTLQGTAQHSESDSEDTPERIGAASDNADTHEKADEREESFADEGGEQVLRKFSGDVSSQSNGGVEAAGVEETMQVRTDDADLPLDRKGSAAGGELGDGRKTVDNLAFSVAGSPKKDRRPGMIQQIILGERKAFPTPLEQSGQKSSVNEKSRGSANVHEKIRGRDEANKMMVSSAEGSVESITNAGQKPSSLILGSETAEPLELLVGLPPSEVLLQTRPVATKAEGVARVAVTFPPALPTRISSPTERTRVCSEALSRPKAAARPVCTCQESVRVLVGPVVGHVGPTSAVVLVEASAIDPAVVAVETTDVGVVRREDCTGVCAAANAVGVQLTDTLTGRRREMTGGEWTRGQSGSGPQVFTFQGLSTGRRYTLKLFGVRRRDQVARTGGFSTPLIGESLPAMWAFSPLAAPAEALDEILADVQTARPTATATLIIGPMVDASKAAQALYPFVMAEKETGTRKKSGLSLEALALSVFRQLYRHAWEEPRMRKLLSNTATTPSSPGAGDLILPLLRNFPPGWLPCVISTHADPLTSSGTKARRGTRARRIPRARIRKVNSAHGRERRGAGVARALRTVAEAALQASKEYQGALSGDSECWGVGSSVHQMSSGGAKECGGPLPAFQAWGPLGVLNISVASSQVDWACGGRDAGRRLLSREAWSWLENFFRTANVCRQGPTLNTLVVVTDSPLVWQSTSSASTAAPAPKRRNETSWNARRGDEGHCRGGRRLRDRRGKKTRNPFSFESAGGYRDASPSWSAHPREAASLLSLLFSWAAAESDDGKSDQDPKVSSSASDSPRVDAQGNPSGAAEKSGTATAWPSSRRRQRSELARGGAVRNSGRVFSIVCPATRVRMNVETFVKDSETGRVAMQWCLASKMSGDEANIPMSGSIGPRFSFTHYPQASSSNGPGASLVRPIPDPCAPCVKFFGMAPLGDSSGSGGGGPGFAFGTVGPILGEVGTSTARILVEVSVPMELRLVLQKSGAARRDDGPQSAGNWQELKEVVREAHRPVVFEVDGLLPDTRYTIDFAPLANASEFRASLRTRPIRPFSFRVAALGGSRNPFGFLPSAAADVLPKSPTVLAGGRVTAANGEDTTATERGEIGAGITSFPGKSLLFRERWPFCTVDAEGRRRAPGDAAAGDGGESEGGTSTKAESQSATKQKRTKGGSRSGRGGGLGGAISHVLGEGRGVSAGGGWRHPRTTALATMVATSGCRLAEMKRESLLSSGGSAEALSVCAEFERLSAWKAIADEVELPAQGLDLIIHLGNEVNAAASLNGTEIDETARAFALQPKLRAQTPLKEALPPTGRMASGSRGGRSLLVRPPQLPVEDPTALGERDEEDISQLEAFLIKLHDKAERDRKRGDGDFRHRRIAEPSLAIRIHFPEDPAEEEGAGTSSGMGGRGGTGATNVDDEKKSWGDGIEVDGANAGEMEPDGDGDGEVDAWSLVAEEVAERVRDPYRVAWGLPWAKAVMSSAPNALMAFTPLDLDEGCEEQVHSRPEDDRRAAESQEQAAIEGGENRKALDHPGSVGRVREERLRAWVEYQAALAPGGGGSSTAPVGSDTAAEGDNKNNSGNINDAGDDGEKRNGKSKSDKRDTDRGSYREYGGIGVLLLDVWGNQPWRLDKAGMATAKGDDQEGPGFHPKALLSKRQEKLVKKALTSSSTNALIICSGTPMVAEPVVHPKAPPLSESEQRIRDKTLSVAKKELKKLGKAGLAEIRRMEEEEKIPKLAMLSPEEVGAMDAFYDESRPCFHWSFHSPYLQNLLEKLFDWVSEGAMPTKKGQPSRKRDVVFICGGTGCGVRTEIRDRRTGLSFTQLCAGRISDTTVPCPWPLAAGSIGDRILFTHLPTQHRDYDESRLHGGQSPAGPAGKTTTSSNSAGISSRSSGNDRSGGGTTSSFSLVTVLSEPLDALITAAVVQPPGCPAEGSPHLTTEVNMHGDKVQGAGVNFELEGHLNGGQEDGERAEIILGPVVGRVEVARQSGLVRESCRVPVVIEVDRGGRVTCSMRDVATSETFREVRVMKSRRPRAFWMQGLRPARRYAIEFEGVSNEGDRTGSLTTPDSSHPDLTIVAVSHDRPGELPSGGEANLWGALGERLRSPWHAVEAVIHLGGQVDLSNAFEDGKSCLESLERRRKAGKVTEEDEATTMEALKERLREEYRKVWNQPCTRRVLASCQHIMMWGQGECCGGYGRGGHAAVSSWAGRRLLRLVKEVFREYQRQLWDPLWGCAFKVGDSESFYTTFLRGTVGILSLDALELSPHWDSSSGNGGGGRGDEKDADGKKSPNDDSATEIERASVKRRDSALKSRKEVPLIGEHQWERLRKTLEEEESLMTLIVVTETPIAWHDTEAFLADAKGASVDSAGDQPPPCLEDHWAARPIQQRALLMRLFQWKAERTGKEVVFLAGAGLAEGCTAAETRLEYKILPTQLQSAGPEEEDGKQKEQGQGKGRGRDEGEEKDAGEERKPKKAKRRLIGIQQVTCGPITAEPVPSPGASAAPAKGTIFVPLTEAEKAQKRLIKANSYKGGSGGGSNDLLVGGGGLLADQEPVTFKHLKTWGRNYAVLQVIADMDEEGPIGVVDTALATPSSLDKTHPKQELSRPPGWWSKRCVGDRTVLLDDDTYLKGQGLKATMEAREWLETNQDFVQATSRSYDDFYIADCGRPTELRTINVTKTAVLKQHVEDGIRAVYRTLPANVAGELAYVPDQMILDFVLVKACPEVKTSALDTAEKWEEVCRQTCIQAAFIRVAALWAEEEEEVLLFADARAEEEVRKAEAKLKRQREREVKEAEKDAAEMADLMANDPEAHMRRVVQKRADDADRRKREAKAKGQDDSLADGESAALDKKKDEDKERLAREAKEKEAREQQELNDLADSDPAEYDRRIKEWQKRKIEGRDGTSSNLSVGGGGDGVDQTQNGDLERRKSLARERRAARRAAMHARPSVGIPKT